jgi:hypothetical protein
MNDLVFVETAVQSLRLTAKQAELNAKAAQGTDKAVWEAHAENIKAALVLLEKVLA